MVPVIVLRLEFGVIILHLGSNEVNGLSNHHWGRAGRTSIFHVRSPSSLACFTNPLVYDLLLKSILPFFFSPISSTYLVHSIALFHKSKESIA